MIDERGIGSCAGFSHGTMEKKRRVLKTGKTGMQNYTKYEKCLDTPTKPLYYYSNTKMKDLRMENLRFLNICLSAFF